MKKVLKAVAIIILSTAVIGGAAIYFYLNSFSHGGNTKKGEIITPKEVKSGDPVNILMLGEDIGTVGSENSPKRSDTMMVFHYEPKTNEVTIVSIPRDTRVIIKGKPEKINAANAYGGPSLAIECVEDLLNISINYYVELNYEAFKKIIDAIGGIDVVIPNNMDYDAESQNLHIHFKKGQKVHLNGEKAEEFVRWRKNNDGTGYVDGDLGRIKAQQDFIIKVIEKMKSPSTVLKIPTIAKILPDYIDTNMDVMTILGYSMEVSKINTNSIQKFTLHGQDKMIGGLSYFIYEPDKNQDIVAKIGGKTSEAGGTTNNINNKNIKVLVYNGSGIDGAGLKIKQELEQKGYTVIGIGNINGIKLKSSHIVDKTLKGGYASQIASDLDIQDVTKDQDSQSKADVLIMLGLDRSNMLN